MSTALGRAIYNRLTGVEVLTGSARATQLALAALLGSVQGKPAVFHGNRSDLPSVPFPCITYRFQAGLDDKLWAGVSMKRPSVAIEIWDNGRTSNVISDIADLMEQLLNSSLLTAPPLPINAINANEWVFWMDIQTPLNTIYDERVHEWAGTLLYEVQHMKFFTPVV